MFKNFLFGIILLFLFSCSRNETRTYQGVVLNSRGQPANNVTVGIECRYHGPMSFGTAGEQMICTSDKTNSAGEFQLSLTQKKKAWSQQIIFVVSGDSVIRPNFPDTLGRSMNDMVIRLTRP